jgi:hypothetical protein
MKTSPYFKMVVSALAALVVAFCLIWNNAWSADTRTAPVLAPTTDPSVMQVVGWIGYEGDPKLTVLYCVPATETEYQCVAYHDDGVVVFRTLPVKEAT